ncbi:DUF6390 family protein [Nocardia sp. NPDC059764]|uniref:DUF6390 family protein n=1 Tax=Nocardia sp. NPDC059764 TaxID=3346939 RepID=UPI00365703E7
MFARYAYPPNALGYCGPPDTTALSDGSPALIRAAARRFTGAWPYLQVMSAMTGIADPLDLRLVESYWHGGGIGSTLDPAAFCAELLAILGPAAGLYWTHLTPRLAPEAAPNHCFHVFGVYPWSRLLGTAATPTALEVLDKCRITPARVVARDGSHVRLEASHLTWDGHHLDLGPPGTRTATLTADGRLTTDPRPGDHVALHWDRLTALLDSTQTANLTDSTLRQLAATNHRLDIDT